MKHSTSESNITIKELGPEYDAEINNIQIRQPESLGISPESLVNGNDGSDVDSAIIHISDVDAGQSHRNQGSLIGLNRPGYTVVSPLSSQTNVSDSIPQPVLRRHFSDKPVVTSTPPPRFKRQSSDPITMVEKANAIENVVGK